MRYALANCDIFTGDGVVYDRAVVINDGHIEQLIELEMLPEGIEVLDLKGANLVPGFVDIQVNGGGGALFNDDQSIECISKMYSGHKYFGTTNFLPTLITSSLENMLRAIDATRQAMQDKLSGVLGLHLEGPYLSPNKAGVHDKRFIRPLDDAELDTILAAGDGVIKLFTIAAEALQESHVRKIQECGIVVSIGHSNASDEQVMQAFSWGVRSVTHLFNAMSPFEGREPGVVGATFDNDQVWAGIIVDGYHVKFRSVRIAKKIKGRKLLLVTDAMPPVGSDSKSFKLGDLEIIVENGRCTTMEGTLAGSALDMASAVRNCIQSVGIPMDEALRMASTYPAELLGIDNRFGRIKPGYSANLIILNNQQVVQGLIREGKYETVQ